MLGNVTWNPLVNTVASGVSRDVFVSPGPQNTYRAVVINASTNRTHGNDHMGAVGVTERPCYTALPIGT